MSVCFFFSSRRRHTRCSRDWSSDVCSSDLLFIRRGDQGVSALGSNPVELEAECGILSGPVCKRSAWIDAPDAQIPGDVPTSQDPRVMMFNLRKGHLDCFRGTLVSLRR